MRYHEYMLEDELVEALLLQGIDAKRQCRQVSAEHKSGYFRPDISIYEGATLLCVIECKRNPARAEDPLRNSRQGRSYRALGVPFFVAVPGNQTEIMGLVDELVYYARAQG